MFITNFEKLWIKEIICILYKEPRKKKNLRKYI